jgi:hypothetical protein
MAGVDPMIRLPEFHGDGIEDPEKHLFLRERIWEAKRITDEATKVAQLAITFQKPHARLVHEPHNKKSTGCTGNSSRDQVGTNQ